MEPCYHLRGNVEICIATYILQADKIDYNSDTGDSELEGQVIAGWRSLRGAR